MGDTEQFLVRVHEAITVFDMRKLSIGRARNSADRASIRLKGRSHRSIFERVELRCEGTGRRRQLFAGQIRSFWVFMSIFEHLRIL